MFRFTKAVVLPNVSAGTYYVDWEGVGNEDVLFAIYYSRESEGSWTLVNDNYQAPGVDVSLTDILNLNFTDPIYFKVEAIGDPSDIVLDTSSVVSDAYIPERTHYLRYREIIRRSQLDITRFIGARTAFLYRLKSYGTPADNVNPILGMPIGTEDLSAVGQRFDGGYHDPIYFYCGWIPTEDNPKSTKQEQGISDARFSKIKLLPTPIIRVYDIIADPDTNDRYIVKAPVEIGSFRGLTITQVASISLLPRTDKAYNLELP